MSVEVNLMQGDCLETLKSLPDNSVDSIVTDPPYGLSFMGKKWDYDVPSVEIWQECFRVLKHGGHLLAFAGTRTQHRMAVRIEDAGFEIRDMIAWVYGSGFPKSHNIHKATGDDRFRGLGTALKPALEPITVARKPLIGTVAQNVLAHGTGGINIDGCRVATNGEKPKGSGNPCPNGNADMMSRALGKIGGNVTPESGRFPANFIHDGSDEVMALFPHTTSGALNRANITAQNGIYGVAPKSRTGEYESNSGSAARFFYCAKASKKDRDEGLSHLEDKKTVTANYGFNDQEGIAARGRNPENHNHYAKNIHPTVKPTDLMRYLCRLVTPPNGTVLDPFMGSGSTGKAAVSEGFNFIGCELSPEYMEIAKARIAHAQGKNNHQVKEYIEAKVDDSKKRKTLFD